AVQGELVLLGGRQQFGTVDLHNCLSPLNILTGVLEIKLVDAPCDPGADGGETGLRFFHPTERADLGRQALVAHFADLHPSSFLLVLSKLDRRARLCARTAPAAKEIFADVIAPCTRPW